MKYSIWVLDQWNIRLNFIIVAFFLSFALLEITTRGWEIMRISSAFLSKTRKWTRDSRKDLLFFLISFVNLGDMMHQGAWFDQSNLKEHPLLCYREWTKMKSGNRDAVVAEVRLCKTICTRDDILIYRIQSIIQNTMFWIKYFIVANVIRGIF